MPERCARSQSVPIDTKDQKLETPQKKKRSVAAAPISCSHADVYVQGHALCIDFGWIATWAQPDAAVKLQGWQAAAVGSPSIPCPQLCGLAVSHMTVFVVV